MSSDILPLSNMLMLNIESLSPLTSETSVNVQDNICLDLPMSVLNCVITCFGFTGFCVLKWHLSFDHPRENCCLENLFNLCKLSEVCWMWQVTDFVL